MSKLLQELVQRVWRGKLEPPAAVRPGAKGRARRLHAAVSAVLLLGAACASLQRGKAETTAAPVALAPHEIDATLFLIGDAGAPSARLEPTLIGLGRQVRQAAERSLVVFLGDNVYPRGLPLGDHAGRREAERRLMAQVETARDSQVRAVIVPGNHDWDSGAKDGLNAIRRMTAFVDDVGSRYVSFEPRDGCPGPVVKDDVAASLRLVVLDTQWWLHRFDRPEGEASPCAQRNETDVVEALRAAVSTAGERRVVVVAHHPLASGGQHGGYFGVREHLFPLLDWKPWLYLPLPVIGSIYPLGRKAGYTPQDFSNEANEKMRAALEGALGARPPLVYAAGHEHNLQVFEGKAARFLLVSGAGSSGEQTPVHGAPGQLFRADKPGFQRLDFLRDGRSLLRVLTVDAAGRTSVAFEHWLE